ncbi:hypothetical protein NGA_0443900 [Nannochloropsis gaditana CCMP526]|uniref:uncharacterized protein n=1 Tax=Nannochloropsis gaditana (strain CCMP526) TaxID=1093141 RepID=UPI00029F67A9|nr:hypothetical protein NGA_0443900 [Nannochloropsis gaditana CCMP526]EKU22577.1 hypothetical protein NGA_0443900 [Nannochloropsis gaditana CCMP526]|eukprot:XP_005853784.1 hypothetical protein NGA_0443900 [Nannochloropsis gaditana CCMP526]
MLGRSLSVRLSVDRPGLVDRRVIAYILTCLSSNQMVGKHSIELDWEALKVRLGSENTRGALETQGMVILDNAFGETGAKAMREEIVFLAERGLMTPNQTRFGPHEVFRKPFIWEADMHDQFLRARVPILGSLLEREALTEGLTPALPPGLGGLRRGMKGRALKVQRNGGGGGSFAWHYDNPGKGSQRRLTCLLYLNPGWCQEHGGELVLQPFLEGSPTVIAPLMDRMLRFSSAEAADPEVLARKLRFSPSQRLVSRAVYAEEYQKSLRECMAGDTPGAKEMLAAHDDHVQAVKQNPAMQALVETLRKLKKGAGDVGMNM